MVLFIRKAVYSVTTFSYCAETVQTVEQAAVDEGGFGQKVLTVYQDRASVFL